MAAEPEGLVAEGARTEMVVWIMFGRAETHKGAREGVVKRASITCRIRVWDSG